MCKRYKFQKKGRQTMKKDKKEKQEQAKVKIKIDKSRIISKIMAVFLLVLMILASCSTCIYFVVTSVK